MTSFIDLVRARRSVRSFNEKEVSDELIGRAIEAARLAPSAHNQQPWKFIVVKDAAVRAKIASACTSAAIPFNKFVPKVPVIVAVVSTKPSLQYRLGAFLKRRPFQLIDLGIAAEHFCLQAADDGLGTCIIGWFSEHKVKRLLHVPFRRRLHLLIAVGFTDDMRERNKKRKNIDEIRSSERY